MSAGGRGRRVRKRTIYRRWGFWLAIVVALALVVGGALLFIQHQRLSGSESSQPAPATTTEPSPPPAVEALPEPTAKPTPKKTKAPKPKVVKRDAKVLVYNNSRITGLATQTANRARSAGWTVSDIGNWRGQVPVSTIYAPLNLADQADLLAKDLGIGRVKSATGSMSRDALTVVLRP